MRYRRAASAALLCLLLVWPALVAASDWSDYPPAARRQSAACLGNHSRLRDPAKHRRDGRRAEPAGRRSAASRMLIRHPQVIIVPGDTTAARQIGDFWWPQLTVPVLALNEDSFTRPGQRILLAAQQLCTQLAPICATLPAKAP